MKAKVLVLPIYRKYWLYHAWKEVTVQEKLPKNWQDAPTLKEKMGLLLSNLQAKASKTAGKQWHKLETAQEGTFNNRLFRLAQWALSKVDPSETFLKALPAAADKLEIMYPASIPERLVRRRLRLLADKAEPFHNSRLRLWSAMLVPQLPLIPLPLPNITIYWTAWRIMSNRSASKGARDLSAALNLYSGQQRVKLAQQLRQLQQQGVLLKRGSWAEQLAADAPRLQQQWQHTLESMQQSTSSSSSSGSGQQQQAVKRLPLPQFVGDQQLERLVQPDERLATPLSEAAVTKLVDMYEQHHLLEHFRAANRKCLGDKAEQQQPKPQQPKSQQQQQQQPKPQQQQPEGQTSSWDSSSSGSNTQQQAAATSAAARQ